MKVQIIKIKNQIFQLLMNCHFWMWSAVHSCDFHLFEIFIVDLSRYHRKVWQWDDKRPKNKLVRLLLKTFHPVVKIGIPFRAYLLYKKTFGYQKVEALNFYYASRYYFEDDNYHLLKETLGEN